MQLAIWLMLASGLGTGQVSDAPLATFDLQTPARADDWIARHDLGGVTASPAGLRLEISGADPYLTGPPRDYPPDVPLQAVLRLRSDEGGMGQLFYFQRGPEEKRSVRFPVRGGGQSVEISVPLPPLDRRYRFRFDPPGARGACVLEHLEVRARPTLTWPRWSAPQLPPRRESDVGLVHGDLHLRHTADRWGAFELRWRGASVAGGHDRSQIGCLRRGEPRWIDIAANARVTVERSEGKLIARANWRDEPEGVEWRLTQYFAPGPTGAIQVTTDVTADPEQQVFFLPTLLVLPGLGSHGPAKSHALAAGYEYLDDEPSSSTADLEGPAAERRVPAGEKVTFPLLAVQHQGHFVALTWHAQSDAAPLFDSPDRTVASHAHVLGTIAPGSDNGEREEGSPLAHRPLRVSLERPIRHAATILVGAGESVVPAIQAYVALRGLPDPPALPSVAAYADETARAWLDTEIRSGSHFRHALGGNFPAHPALDAAWMLEWLAEHVSDATLAARCRDVAREAAQAVPAGHGYHSHVGHLKWPTGVAIFGRLEGALGESLEFARHNAARFDADGIVRYARPAAGIDYSRTQPSREASGFAALPVQHLLEAARFAGDRELMAVGLERLAALEKYRAEAPRGAQTWEIPLHTPDIMASAHLVRAYTVAYEWTGEKRWLDRAVEWAWTGVPFVYLRRPAEGPVGEYATIAVYGATQWQAPVWIGLPVQWCGLVYADALRQLARHDPRGPWRQIAVGITASAIQQTYPPNHPRRGLLPDSFSLTAQARNPSDINPGTLQPLAGWALTGRPAWDVVPLGTGATAFGPGSLTAQRVGDATRVVFQPWRKSGSSTLLFQGLRAAEGKSIKFLRDGKPLSADSGVTARATERGAWLLEVVGGVEKVELEIEGMVWGR